MSPFTRRGVLAAFGGAAALTPVAHSGTAVATNDVDQTLRWTDPKRLFDSRTDGDKIAAQETITVPVLDPTGTTFLRAALLNITVTETEGAGFLRVNQTPVGGGDPVAGDYRPDLETSNVNWSQEGQTLANLAFTGVGGETGVDIYCGGAGRAHVVVDLQGYVQGARPFPGGTE